MHRVVRGVDVQAAEIAAILQQIDGGSHQPVIDFAAVDTRRGAEPLHPILRRLLGRENQIGAGQRAACRLLLRRQQSGFHAVLLRPLKQRRREQQVGGLHVFLASRALVEVRIAGDAMLIGPHAATDGRVVGVGDGRHRVPTRRKIPGVRHRASTGMSLCSRYSSPNPSHMITTARCGGRWAKAGRREAPRSKQETPAAKARMFSYVSSSGSSDDDQVQGLTARIIDHRKVARTIRKNDKRRSCERGNRFPASIVIGYGIEYPAIHNSLTY